MTWEVNNVMEQREKFIKAWYSGQLTKTELCRRFNISRPTGDKWIKRHFEGGIDALADMSKAPLANTDSQTPIVYSCKNFNLFLYV